MQKVLVANRGEIALRVMRACRELGLASVAVFSEADREGLFVSYADEAFCIGPAAASQSYLNVEGLIETAKNCGADAIHPGYGFLAENAAFAAACEAAGITFIGPSARVIELMGSKVAAREEMRRAGVPVVPGSEGPVRGREQALATAAEIGYPVIVKPSAGGGGIGMSVVHSQDDLLGSLERSEAMARQAFGVPELYLERYLPSPRHIEVQILGDSHGNVIHLGERECSIQRRYQKLVEEAPSTALTPELRSRMGEVAARAARVLGYVGAGTIEFLFFEGNFFFLEMNTRIQVEHPVTEMVTGIDIVKEQIRVSAGEPLGIRQEDVRLHGWAIECRINAEDPEQDFAPAPGRLKGYQAPGGIGVRVDSAVYSGYVIPPFYDSLIAKLVVWGRDRSEAIARMKRALYEYVLTGSPTNLAFQRAVMENPRFVRGDIDTHFLEQETGLLAQMDLIRERERSLGERLPAAGDKMRIAAAAGAAAAAAMQQASSIEATPRTGRVSHAGAATTGREVS